MAGQLITRTEQWWRTPAGDVVRVRPTAPDQNGRGRVEMRWASGDVAYVWEKHTSLLLDAGSVPCDPQPGMLA
jgi:hypothetical protein